MEKVNLIDLDAIDVVAAMAGQVRVPFSEILEAVNKAGDYVDNNDLDLQDPEHREYLETYLESNYWELEQDSPGIIDRIVHNAAVDRAA